MARSGAKIVAKAWIENVDPPTPEEMRTFLAAARRASRVIFGTSSNIMKKARELIWSNAFRELVTRSNALRLMAHKLGYNTQVVRVSVEKTQDILNKMERELLLRDALAAADTDDSEVVF